MPDSLSLLALLLFAWIHITGAFIVLGVASEKGRSGFGWMAISLLMIGPLLALIALAALPPVAQKPSGS